MARSMCSWLTGLEPSVVFSSCSPNTLRLVAFDRKHQANLQMFPNNLRLALLATRYTLLGVNVRNVK